ncbi:MAG TPA: DsbA family protein [Patescibacteria group bacterium]|nr:DsbA family protein [Patescibacteria group bacterium]
MKKYHTLIILLGLAIALAAIGLFVRFIQYQPLLPSEKKIKAYQEQIKQMQIPVYADDPIIGDKKAGITIIAFEDFACQACKFQFSLLEQIQKQYPQRIKIIWKGLTVTKFPHSTELANKYAYCANQQEKFNEFYPLAFTNSDKLTEDNLQLIAEQIKLNKDDLSSCLTNAATADYLTKTEQLGLLLHIQQVPTFFLESKQIKVPASAEDWRLILGL